LIFAIILSSINNFLINSVEFTDSTSESSPTVMPSLTKIVSSEIVSSVGASIIAGCCLLDFLFSL